jgi:hypothetical protein
VQLRAWRCADGRLKRSAQRAHAAAAPRIPLDTIERPVRACTAGNENDGQVTRDHHQLDEYLSP